MKRLTTNLIAAGIGSAAGYAFHQKQHRQPPGPGEQASEVVVAAPLANVAASTLAGLLLGSPVAAFLAGFTISATMGTKLGQMVRDAVGGLG